MTFDSSGTPSYVPAPSALRATPMYYVIPTGKDVATAARDLETAVRTHGFGVLHVYDLKETLTSKGHPLRAECRIFEVCNPAHASRVLERDMRLNMALPCRISVFEDQGTTKIGTILPTEMLRALSPDRELAVDSGHRRGYGQGHHRGGRRAA